MTSPIPDFSACRERIDRANSKAQFVIDQWKSLHENNRPKTSLKDKGDGRHIICVTSPSIPSSLALELGEVLYQIRAALDNAVYASCVCDCTNDFTKYERDIGFPVCATPKSFKDRVEHKCLDKKRIQILRTIQPFYTDNMPNEFKFRCYSWAFHVLNEWAKIDRHRRLHVLTAAFFDPSISFTFGKQVVIANPTLYKIQFLEGETDIGELTIINPHGTPTTMDTETNSIFDIEIGIKEPPLPLVQEDTLTHRLNTIFEASRAIIQAFQESYS